MTLSNDSNDYAAATRRAESALTNALETWKNGLNALTAALPTSPAVGKLPQVDATEALERQLNLIQQLVDVNAGYARQLAEATNTVNDAVRQHLEGLSSVMQQQVQSVSETTQRNVERLEETVHETADQAEQVQREARERAAKVEREQRQQAAKAESDQRRQTAKVEREQREQAEQAEREKRQQAQKAQREKRQQARERYSNLNKNELSDEAAKRNLPKTGNVDELVDRLVEHDLNK